MTQYQANYIVRNYQFVLVPVIVMFSILIILLIHNNALAEPFFNDPALKD
jgi:hypothetical protein